MIKLIYVPVNDAIKIVQSFFDIYPQQPQEEAPEVIWALINSIVKNGYVHQGYGVFTKPV